MLFNSWEFIVLVLTTLLVYYLPTFRKYQIYVLILASLFFYAYDNLSLLLLLVGSGFINALSSYGAKYRHNSRVYSTIGVMVNLFVLALFKYGGLISDTFLDTNDSIGKFLCTLPCSS